MTKPVATVAFSGAGHLLAYHLGVASVLRRANASGQMPTIQAVSGSSSGAIVAAVMAIMPHRLEEYAERFLQDRGRAFANFQEMIKDDNNHDSVQEELQPLDLSVCVAKSEDGSPHLFSFSPTDLSSSQERLFQAIQASCRIPMSFHPLDLFQASVSYQSEGIEIDSTYYVDGGISGVFPPPLPQDLDPNLLCHRILVSPISLKPIWDDHNTTSQIHLISPYSGSYLWGPKSRDGMARVIPSLANLRALNVAAGFASGPVLEDWYERGREDAAKFVDKQDFGRT